MDNTQPTTPADLVTTPESQLSPAMPTVQPDPNATPSVPPIVNPAPTKPSIFENTDLIKTIAIIGASLIAVVFIGLFIWMTVRYNEASSDTNTKIDQAVAEAKKTQAEELEAKYVEEIKYPYSTFAGPVDYGELSFEYPKTWSVYIGSDATNGGNFEAYLNPREVNPVSKDTINALRVSIVNKSYENVMSEYQKAMDRKDSDLQTSIITVNDFSSNRYVGTIPNTNLKGIIVILKIRDKTAILQTDSMLFEEEFNKLLETVTFNS